MYSEHAVLGSTARGLWRAEGARVHALLSAGSKVPREWEEAIQAPPEGVKEALTGTSDIPPQKGEGGTAEGRPWGARLRALAPEATDGLNSGVPPPWL